MTIQKFNKKNNLELIKDWTVKKSLGDYLEYARQIIKVNNMYESIAKLTAEKMSQIDAIALMYLKLTPI